MWPTNYRWVLQLSVDQNPEHVPGVGLEKCLARVSAKVSLLSRNDDIGLPEVATPRLTATADLASIFVEFECWADWCSEGNVVTFGKHIHNFLYRHLIRWRFILLKHRYGTVCRHVGGFGLGSGIESKYTKIDAP